MVVRHFVVSVLVDVEIIVKLVVLGPQFGAQEMRRE
jgi:hypothetical protein